MKNQDVPADKTLRVVAIGGGTGLSTLLRGLKQFVPVQDRRKGERGGVPPQHRHRAVIGELTAVVTVTDDGGSSGRLREDLNILP
ncbi:MAG TPA: 2-phospho-L-lactate transferase CofD family protein, partial [Edaphobacter sp.]